MRSQRDETRGVEQGFDFSHFLFTANKGSELSWEIMQGCFERVEMCNFIIWQSFL